MVVEDAKASYLGNGVLLLVEINEDRNFDHTFVSACSISDTLRITPDRQNPDYVVSGDIKKVCGSSMILDQTPRNFGVKAIKRRL
ncbi:MAG TPA: hypothetical protein VGN64_20775 [Dyadobacter sp.]|nr:hypothetical protein [Dyadobacter sp.]